MKRGNSTRYARVLTSLLETCNIRVGSITRKKNGMAWRKSQGWRSSQIDRVGGGRLVRRARSTRARARTTRRPATVRATTWETATQPATRAPDASRVRIATKTCAPPTERSFSAAAALKRGRASRRRRPYLRCADATTKRTPTAARRFRGVTLRGVSAAAGRGEGS